MASICPYPHLQQFCHIIALLIHFSLFFLFLFLRPVNCSEDEERLVRDLFRDYNKLIRPVKNINDTVPVEVKLSFIQLINIVSILL